MVFDMGNRVDVTGTFFTSVIGAAVSYGFTYMLSSIVPALESVDPLPCAVSGFACGGIGYLFGFLCGVDGDTPILGTYRKRKMIAGFSKRKAVAILDAYSADTFIPASGCSNEVMASLMANDRVFIAESLNGYGSTIITSYQITDGWRKFLSKDANRSLVESRAK